MSDRGRLLKSWAATERDIRAAMAELDLGPEVSASVDHYLDHNELGLAFTALVEALDRTGVGLTPTAMDRLRAAYERMGRPSDSTEAWERVGR